MTASSEHIRHRGGHLLKNRWFRYISATALVLLCIGIVLWWRGKPSGTPSEEGKPTRRPRQVETYYLGLRTDTLQREDSKVKPGASLSLLLGAYRVPAYTIDRLARLSRPVFDVRHIRSGQPCTALLTKEETPRLRYWIYGESPTDFVVFDLGDSLCVYRRSREIFLKEESLEAVIEHSLWEAIRGERAPLELCSVMSDIYAWQIDFFSIQKGDAFKVIYEKRMVDDTTCVGVGAVKAAVFRHSGQDYYAIPFVQDGFLDYFDRDGVNLRRAFLKSPLRYSRISSKFSNGRMHPVLRIVRPHHGVDYAAPTGTPVHSIGQGVVVKKAYQANGGGHYITIKHNGTYSSTYMHLSGYAKGMEVGRKVSQGETIGYVGSTGISTGPHLDFRVYRNGQPIDPLKMESPPATPLKESLRDSFNLVKDQWIKTLSWDQP